MYKILNKKSLLMMLGSFLFLVTFAQDKAATASGSSFSISTNTMLLIIASVLLLVILALTGVVYSAIDLYKSKHPSNASAKKIVSVLILLAINASVWAQTAPATPAAAPAESSAFSANALSLILIIFVLFEIGIILYLIKQIRFLTGIEELQKQKIIQGSAVSAWDKINNFKPLEKEQDLDLGHSYDGIRELDNVAPPWFTIGFAFTIFFAVVYLYRYHVAESAPLQIAEYEQEVQKAKVELENLAKTQPAATVDENNLKLLGAADIAKGKELFIKNCATCHLADGGGSAGPNLTDDYWIHGGSLKDIFMTIKNGYADKGMPNWSTLLNPTQIDQVTSFIKSLKGTKPAVAKDKQGDLYVEKSEGDAASAPADSATASK